jgi:site-specific DNA-methyltransferase (adenine-specific)
MLTSPVLEYDQHNVQLWRGDCLHCLWDIPTNSVDSIVTDPPAGIAFMGKSWDKNRGGRDKWVDWLTERMEEAYRVLKPGSHALVWALPRTSHWTALSLEDAGFEIRDCITHLFGTGFPKGKSQLKPASEHWWLVRKLGKSALNIDACRIPVANASDQALYAAKCASVIGLASNRNGSAYGEWTSVRENSSHVNGRWPSNIILSHASTPDGYDACVDGCPVAELDHQSGICQSSGTKNKGSKSVGLKIGSASIPIDGLTSTEYADSGTASRFFPIFRYQAKAPTSERPKIEGKSHPTVKSLELMRWLIRLITPPGGIVLDMFAGSGSTGEAARAEGMSAILIDSDPESIAWSIQRLERTASLPA